MGLLKRKRSESEFSFSSQNSSPQRPGSSNFFFPTMAVDAIPYSRSAAPSHLPSRTTKRYRDNRPSEAAVHEHTLGLLYSAQQLPVAAHPLELPQSHALPQRQAAQATPSIRQSSLHSFWKLPSSSAMSIEAPPSPVVEIAPTPTNCDDCGIGLSSSGGGDDAMDVDTYGSVGGCCSTCGKAVCLCSVGNLGQERNCLVCAGRKRHTSPIGWPISSGAGLR